MNTNKFFFIFGALAFSFVLMSFTQSQNFGVKLVPTNGNLYRVDLKNSIADADKSRFVTLAKTMYGVDLKSKEDFEVSMRAGRRFIGRIKFLSNFEEYIWEQDSEVEAVRPTANETEMINLLAKYKS